MEVSNIGLPEDMAQRGGASGLGEVVGDDQSPVTAPVKRVLAGVAHGGVGP